MKKKLRRSSGFTLVELIVVIAILALLAAVAIPKYNESREKAAITAHESNIRILESAALTFLSSEGVPTSSMTWSNEENTQTWQKYLKEWPEQPQGLPENYEKTSYRVSISTGGDVTVTPSTP